MLVDKKMPSLKDKYYSGVEKVKLEKQKEQEKSEVETKKITKNKKK